MPRRRVLISFFASCVDPVRIPPRARCQAIAGMGARSTGEKRVGEVGARAFRKRRSLKYV